MGLSDTIFGFADSCGHLVELALGVCELFFEAVHALSYISRKLAR